MFSQSTKVCLKALSCLIERDRGAVVQSSDIARELEISATYVTKVFQPLCRKGWLRSQKGRTGGWVLVADPATLTLADAVAVLEPQEQWKRCLAGQEVCSGDSACLFLEAWSQAVEAFCKVLEKTRLDRLPMALPPCFGPRYHCDGESAANEEPTLLPESPSPESRSPESRKGVYR